MLRFGHPAGFMLSEGGVLAPTFYTLSRCGPNVASITNAGKTANPGASYATWTIAGTTGDRSSGKWYFEFLCVAGGTYWVVGIAKSNEGWTDNAFPGSPGNGYSYYSGGAFYHAGTSSGTPAAYAATNVIGVKLDCDAWTIEFLKNNASQGSQSITPAVYCPASSVYGTVAPTSTTIRTLSSEFTYGIPSGYRAIG